MRIDKTRLIDAKLQCHGVDGEVTPLQIGLDRVTEGHRWLATVLDVHLGAKRCDLVAIVALDGPDCPECFTHRVEVVRPCPDEPLDLARSSVGGEVQICRLTTQYGVSHRSSDQIDLMAGIGEQARQFCGRARGQPDETFRDHVRRIRGS